MGAQRAGVADGERRRDRLPGGALATGLPEDVCRLLQAPPERPPHLGGVERVDGVGDHPLQAGLTGLGGEQQAALVGLAVLAGERLDLAVAEHPPDQFRLALQQPGRLLKEVRHQEDLATADVLVDQGSGWRRWELAEQRSADHEVTREREVALGVEGQCLREQRHPVLDWDPDRLALGALPPVGKLALKPTTS